MTASPPDPPPPAAGEQAADQYTTALPRRPRRPPADVGGTVEAGPAAEYQETTVLRRPARPPTASNVPGATRTESAAYPPADTPTSSYPPADAPAPRPSRGRDGSHLPPYAGPAIPASASPDPEDAHSEHWPEGPPASGAEGASHQPTGRGRRNRPAPARGLQHPPRKLTVTRVAALRSRELTHRGLERFHGAVSADGADRSGLGHLTYAVMGNYAVDAALAVALANTLFFAAAKAESTGKVLLYLLLTVAPFAVIAPLIGPALDKLQHGRRIALAASSVGRAALAVVMALNFDSWIIYPCALGMLVLSKGFGVLKAALTPRVLPEAITLVKTNSRLSVFGLIAGGVSGGVAAGIAALTDSSGALWFTAACGLVGAWLCLRIPAWVESTVGELPIHHTGAIDRPQGRPQGRPHSDAPALSTNGAVRRGLPRVIVTALWANSVIRIETGFLALFIAFVIKTRYQTAPAIPTPGVALGPGTDDQGWMQLLLLGAVGAAAGLGGFVGNALGARLPLRSAEAVALWCLAAVILSVILAFILPGMVTAGAVAFVGSTGSSLAKVCLDATIQQNLPEASRASAFGRSESVLQLSWVSGGMIGLLIGGIWALGGEVVFRVGFGIIGALLVFGFAQTIAVRLGRSLLPSWRGMWHGIWRAMTSSRRAGSMAPAAVAQSAAAQAASQQAAAQQAAAQQARTTPAAATHTPTRTYRTRKAGRPR